MDQSYVPAVKPENPFEVTINPTETVQENSLTKPSPADNGSNANQAYQDYPKSNGNTYASLPVAQQIANEPKDKRTPEKIDRSKLDEIAATLSSNPEPNSRMKLPAKPAPEKHSEPTSSQDAPGDQDNNFAEYLEFYGNSAEDGAPGPELGVHDIENKRFDSFEARVAEDLSQGGNASIFDPEGHRDACLYFADMWFPWFIVFLNILMDFILMFYLSSPIARSVQGFLLFLPYIIFWSSSYNTSKYEEFYQMGRMDMPVTAWLNGLPWTGVPMVFLQESYLVLWRVIVFPGLFLRHRCEDAGRPFQLSGNMYNQSKDKYLQIVRVVFEDLPTTLLLIVVLAQRKDNGRVIFFSMVTSLASCACSIFAVVMSPGRGGRPIYLEIFTILMNHQTDLTENTS